MKRKNPEKPAEPPTKVEEQHQETPLLHRRRPLFPIEPRFTVAFRFAFIYFGLFCLTTQIAGSLFLTPASSFRGLGILWPMRPLTIWIADRFFGVTEPLAYGRNSGETLFFWFRRFGC
jgi:hypothetical protein